LKKALLIIIVFLFSSCKKEHKQEQFQKEIAGTWEYESFAGYPYFPSLPPGNGSIIVLSESGVFERWQHDTLIFKGTYQLIKKNDCQPRVEQFTFFTNEPYSGKARIDVKDDKLTISYPVCLIAGGTT